ncbi:MAG: hypothetical protein K6E20_01165 [Acholeplasmatales bacterium]|nr:hypothetical protein [Acholeplasmatales bacterium]
MKKKTLYRKLIMSASAAAMAAVCLTATTYAWFSRNETVWVDETKLEIDSYEGLLISLDGKTFSQDITADQLKMKLTGETTKEAAREAYNNIKINGSTLRQDDTGKIVYDEGSAIFDYDVENYTEGKYTSYIKLKDQFTGNIIANVSIRSEKNDDNNYDILETTATDADGNSLTIEFNETTSKYEISSGSGIVATLEDIKIDPYVKNLTAKDNSGDGLEPTITYVDNGYTHETETAVANQRYLKFDLYFRLISDSNATAHDDFKLVFTEDTFIKSASNSKNTLDNALSTQTKDYQVGDEIEFDVANAMRLGIDNDYYGGLKTFEVTNDLDLGSSAIEGSTNPIHDPSKNAMYTYYNNLFPKNPFKEAAADGERFETFNSFTNTTISEFKYADGAYNDIKATFYVWLEGWDADYFLGVPQDARTISIKLDFTYEKVE